MRMFGVKEMLSVLRQIQRTNPGRIGRALRAEGRIEMTESKRRVPVDKGDLRDSGMVSEPIINGNNVSVILSYGGGDYPHDPVVPIIQHEDFDLLHKVGGPKYLESVLDESEPYMGERLARRLHLSSGDK